MGEAHYLKPNHKCEMPSRMICVDTEAWMDQEVQTLRLGNALYLRRQRGDQYAETELAFRTKEEYWSWVDSIMDREGKVRIWMVSHNMSYDFPILDLDAYFGRKDWDAPSLAVFKAPFLFYTRKGDVSMNVISSTNLYPGSLKSIGERLGVKKLDMTEEQMRTSSDEELARYCRQDTRVLAEVMKYHIRYLTENDLGGFKPTLAGQAMAAYRHRFMGDNKLLVHHYPRMEALEVESYRGGRVEMLRRGKFQDVFNVDVNSMYPFVMKGHDYPVCPRGKAPFLPTKAFSLDRAMEDSFIIARCLLDLKQPCIAVHRDDKLIFPVGHVNAVITSPEIEYIRNHPDCGSIERPVEVMAYEQGSIFDDYVDFFYAWKRDSPDAQSKHIAKIMLNALYGKFGQRLHAPQEELTDEGDVQALLEDMKALGTSVISNSDGRKFVRIGEKIMVFSREKGAMATNSMPRIASAVTAYARVVLQDLMDTIGSREVYYMDTDGLYITRKGFERVEEAGLLDENQLGKLKCTGPCEFEPRTGKDYDVDGVRKTKGIRKDAEQLGPNTFRQKRFETGNSRYRSGIQGGVRVLNIEKTCTGNYSKGTVLANGLVEPLRLAEW
jgi:hypothetical protein